MKIYIKTNAATILSNKIDVAIGSLPSIKEKMLEKFYQENKIINVGTFRKNLKEFTKKEFFQYIESLDSLSLLSFKLSQINCLLDDMKETLIKLKKGISLSNNINAEYIEISDNEISILDTCESWNI